MITLALYISPRSLAAASRRWCIHGAFVSRPQRISSSKASTVRTANAGLPFDRNAMSCATQGAAPHRFLCVFSNVFTTYFSCDAHGSLRSCLLTNDKVFSSNTLNTRCRTYSCVGGRTLRLTRHRFCSDLGRHEAAAASTNAICRESNPLLDPFNRTKTSRMAAMRWAVSGSRARKKPHVSINAQAASTLWPSNRSKSQRIASNASASFTMRNLTSSPKNLAFLSLCSNVVTSFLPSLERTQNSVRMACATGASTSSAKTCPSVAAILA